MIPIGGLRLPADLSFPPEPRGIVIFAHGSGSGRKSPRNRSVARVLQDAGVATLLLDLLDPREAEEDEQTAQFRFDIPLLSARVVAATDWLTAQLETRGLPIGYYGASTGGAAAMIAASERPREARALVLRGARTDLASNVAPGIACPTLILVGERDPDILDLNRQTMALLRCEKQLIIVPRATHLFEEPGALEFVAEHSRTWFTQHLSGRIMAAARTQGIA